jgi:hypothetical protein
MELLGTTGNQPGPTAAKAQAVYDNLQKTAELNAVRKRRKVYYCYNPIHSPMLQPGFPSGLSLFNSKPTLEKEDANGSC